MPLLDNYLLPLSVALPFLAGLALLLGGSRLPAAAGRALAWFGFAAPAAAALYAWMAFAQDGRAGRSFAFSCDTGLGFLGINLDLALTGLSLPMFVLAGVVGLAAGVQALYSKPDRPNAYCGLILFMIAGLMGVFASRDIFFFYFFHEFALIPTFVLIGWWGGREGRGAAMQMTIYLTLGAMLSLLGLIALYTVSGAESFNLDALAHALSLAPLEGQSQRVIFGLLMFGFGILVSLWPFHTWAPAGYAAAPTPAAMLHAGVLKKFGLYGLLQIAIPLLPEGLGHWGRVLAWLALGNIVIIGLVTMAQRDLKVMFGYSSVMHMGYIFLGLVCASALGAGGATLLMFAHGLSVAALFLLGDAVRSRTGTWDMGAIGGLGQKAPVLMGFFVATTLASAGLPGFANFWGEFSVFLALWAFDPWMVAPAALGVIISAIYGLRAASRVFFGQPTENFKPLFDTPLPDIHAHERWPALLLLGVLLLAGFWPASLTRGINAALPAAYKQQGEPDIAGNAPRSTPPAADRVASAAQPEAVP